MQLTEEEQKIAEEIKDYLRNWADKLGLPQDSRIASYITHIFEDDFITKEFDDDIARLLTDKVPGSVYDPFLQKRLGKQGYIEDVWASLDAYVKRATRKYNLDPALADIESAANTLETSAYNYVRDFAKRINMQPTEIDTMIDNFIKATPIGYRFGQRPTNNITRRTRQMIYRGALGLNVGSAVRNLTQGVNTYAELGEVHTIKGYAKLFQKLVSGDLRELEKNNVLSQNIVDQDRKYNAIKSLWEKADNVLFFVFDLAEKINRGSAYYGAKSKALAQGKTEEQALAYAKDVVARTQFEYGSINTPMAMQSDLAKTVGQFMTFAVKQGEFVGEKVKKRDILGLARFTGATFVMSYAMGRALGVGVNMWEQFGVPGMLAEGAYNTLTGEERTNARMPLPPAASIVGGAMQIPQALTGDKYSQNEVLKSGALMLPGGNQLKKTVEGIGAYNQGYSETPSGNIRYAIDQNVPNRIRTSLLGQYGTPEAAQYFSSGEKPITSKNDQELIRELGPEGYAQALENRKQRRIDRETVTPYEQYQAEIKAREQEELAGSPRLQREREINRVQREYKEYANAIQQVRKDPELTTERKNEIVDELQKELEQIIVYARENKIPVVVSSSRRSRRSGRSRRSRRLSARRSRLRSRRSRRAQLQGAV